MIITTKHSGYTRDGIRLYPGGGGGGQPTTQTVQQSNIPEYARPYVESMLGATQQQLFNTTQTPEGTTQITGIKPYQAFGAQGAGMGPTEQAAAQSAVAGFTPMQQQAQQGIAGLQVPGQFGAATEAAMMGTQAALNAGQYQPGYFGNQFQAPPSYQPGQFSMLQAQAPDLQQFQMGPAERVQGGQYAAPEMAAAQTQFRPDLQAFQMGPAERAQTQSFTQPGSAEAYMSPFMQNVVDKQTREAERQAGLAAKQERAQSIQRGAFGGGRTAVREAAAARDLAQLKSDIYGTGQQAAFQNAQQQFNAEQQARMQAQLANQQAGLTVGGQNLAAQLGVQQLGTQTGLQSALANLSSQQQANVQNQAAQLQAQGLTANQAMQAALANQQAGLTTGQQNLAAQLGIQQLGAGQNLQAQLANQQALQTAQQAGEQSRQFGYGQGMTAAQQRAQYGLAGQQAEEQSRQFGAGLGLQGAQAGLQGAGQLANIGGQQLGAQQGIYGLQAQTGAQQQAQQQQIINQMLQNYATTQQYPQQQLAFMNAMLRGLPLQTMTTQGYQAAPSMASQVAGLGLAGAGMYGMMNRAPGSAKGGAIKDKDKKTRAGLDELALMKMGA